MEKLLGIPEVYMKIIMSSNYTQADIFYSSEQMEKAVESAYPDMDKEIVSDYRGLAMQRALRCCYEDLGGEIVLPCKVILDYITPVNDIEELVFLSSTDIGKHLTLVDSVDKLLQMTDVHQRTTVEPAYIEFATQESAFLGFVKKVKKK